MGFVVVWGERRRSVFRLGDALLLVACAEHDVTIASPIPNPAPLPLPVPLPPPPAPSVSVPAEPSATAPDFGNRAAAPLTPTPPPPVNVVPDDVGPDDVGPDDVAPDVGTQEPTLALNCAALPEAPLPFESLLGFSDSEDFAFDAQGNYVGIDEDENLVRISKEGARQLWAPATGTTAGMALLPDGSLVFCQVDSGELRRTYANGSTTVVLGGLAYPNGMTLGPDGFVYVAENAAGRVRRVNPDTGEFSIVAMGLYGPNGVAFSPDPGVLYVGSFEGFGVYRIELDAPGQLGSARVFASTPGSSLPEPHALCRDLQEGDACQSEWSRFARCQRLANVVDCVAIDPCPELADGEVCNYPWLGECRAGHCEQVPDACKTGQAGDTCHVAGAGDGQCRLYVAEGEPGDLYCELPTPCDGLQAGDSCQDGSYETTGVCTDYGDGLLGCAPRNPCDGKAEGATCEETGVFTGTCRDVDGVLYCQPPTGCENKQEAEPCQEPSAGIAGYCADYTGTLYCVGPTGCEGKQEAEPCQAPPGDFEGLCIDYGSGPLQCGSPTGCEGKQAADACEDPSSQVQGFCADAGGWLYCSEPTGCEGKLLGESCGEASSGGSCVDSVGTLYCVVSCMNKADGDPCQGDVAGSGYCWSGECQPLSAAGSGIDGLGVDACGNVYATEFTSGVIWRIDPEGQLEELVRLPSMWIPNVKWGRDLGGFSSTTLYVADRDVGRLFALPVGVPSAQAVLERGTRR